MAGVPVQTGSPSRSTWDLRAANAVTALMVLAVTCWTIPVVAGSLVWAVAIWPFKQLGAVRALSAATERAADRVAPHVFRDRANARYLVPMVVVSTVVPAAMLLAIVWEWQNGPGIDWRVAYLFMVVLLGPYFAYFSHVATLVHHEAHTTHGLFSGRLRPLNRLYSWFLGPLYGHVPEGYRVGHVVLHHRYDNGPEDLTTTLDLDRRLASAWLVYMRRFAAFWSGASVVLRCVRDDRPKRARQMAAGMAAYYLPIAAVALVSPGFAFAYLLLPHMVVIVLMGAINYTWHAFADPHDPTNPLTNSITIVDGTYNLFDEDYHAAHHVRPQQHWNQQRAHYAADGHAAYRQHHATVFAKCQAFEVFLLIVFGQHRALARRLVDLSGGLTEDAKVRLIRERLRPAF